MRAGSRSQVPPFPAFSGVYRVQQCLHFGPSLPPTHAVKSGDVSLVQSNSRGEDEEPEDDEDELDDDEDDNPRD